jgi:hypothetical protein
MIDEDIQIDRYFQEPQHRQRSVVEAHGDRCLGLV